MFWAHYSDKIKQSQQEHSQMVGDGCRAAVSDFVHFEGIDAACFRRLVGLCGEYHDLGKFTDFFQNYMVNGVNSQDKDHAPISAVFVYNLLNHGQDAQTPTNRMAYYLCYLAVRQHHGNLRAYGFNQKPQEMLETLRNKSNNLLKNEAKIQQELSASCGKQDFISCLKLDLEALKRICNIQHDFKRKRSKNAQWFFFVNLLFSILIDQDKMDSAQITKRARKQIAPSRITAFLESKKNVQAKLNERRDKANQEIMQVLYDMTDEEIINKRIFTLTGPTGIGKTLASLQAASYISSRLLDIGTSQIPRIITAIPFINIIEQNLSDYQAICGEDIKLLAHYHLGQMESTDSEDTPLEKVLLEAEAWEADMVMTTFVQLFHSLLSNRNRSLKKVNKLSGSIVILDEIQALPDKYLALIGALIRRLAFHYGTRFILMTATQPKIMEFADLLQDTQCQTAASVELLPNHATYFEHLKRTKFISLLEDKPIDEDRFLEIFQAKYDGKKAALVVLNTIQRSLNVYQKLTDLYPKRVLYLSTNIIPKARKRVIKKARRYLKYKIPFVLVSTQTIEAGVDMDFDLAFRDLAPLPSLIQIAGRVNRNNSKGEHLPVYLIEMENDCGLIYGTAQKNEMKNLLKDKPIIMEEEYRVLIDRYYTQLLRAGLSDESKEIWEKGIVELNYEDIKNFELIKNSSDIADVFVEYDNEAVEHADLYVALRKELREAEDENYFAIKAKLKNVLSAMQQYFISVRVKRIRNNAPPSFDDRSLGDVKSDFYWVPQGQLHEYYDVITGFKDEGDAFLY